MPVPGQVITVSDAVSDFPNSPTLTVQEAVLLAMRNNPDVKNAELQRVVDKFSLAVAHNAFLPQYTVKGDTTYKTGSKPSYSAHQGVSLLAPFGTTFSTGLDQAYDPGNDARIKNSATFGVTQPLLRGFGSAVTQVDLANAIDAEKANQLSFKSKVMDTTVTVVNDYYQLVGSYNSLEINQITLKNAEKTLQETLAKIKAGKSAPAEKIQQQAAIASTKLDIESTKNSIRQDYQTLLTVLGLDPQAKLNIVKKIDRIKSPLPTLEESIQQALETNVNYQSALINFRSKQRALLTAKDNQKWKLDATAQLDQALFDTPGSRSTDKSLKLDLEIPIHDLSSQSTWVNAKISLDQAKTSLEQTKRQLIADVTNAYHSLEFNQRQIALYEDSIKLEQQNLDNSNIKFNYGKISSFELITQQTSLTTKQLGYASQQITYLNNIESFYQKLGTTLDKWHITLAY